MQLTHQGSQIIEEIARRYYVSVDAVMTLLYAVNNGGGTMAQFSHPEFGGSGQWMQGGMTMVGDMFNNSLKAKVDNLCSELSQLLANQPLFVQPAPSPTQNQGGYDSVSLFVNGGGNQEHKEIKNPAKFYRKVIEDTEGAYQILCAQYLVGNDAGTDANVEQGDPVTLPIGGFTVACNVNPVTVQFAILDPQ